MERLRGNRQQGFRHNYDDGSDRMGRGRSICGFQEEIIQHRVSVCHSQVGVFVHLLNICMMY